MKRKLGLHSLILCVLVCLLAGCGGKDGSILAGPPKPVDAEAFGGDDPVVQFLAARRAEILVALLRLRAGYGVAQFCRLGALPADPFVAAALQEAMLDSSKREAAIGLVLGDLDALIELADTVPWKVYEKVLVDGQAKVAATALSRDGVVRWHHGLADGISRERAWMIGLHELRHKIDPFEDDEDASDYFVDVAHENDVAGACLAQYLAFVALQPAGSADLSFGTNGLATTQFLSNVYFEPRALDVYPDGRVLAAGGLGTSSVTFSSLLVRFTGDGLLDGTFGEGGVQGDSATSHGVCSVRTAADSGGMGLRFRGIGTSATLQLFSFSDAIHSFVDRDLFGAPVVDYEDTRCRLVESPKGGFFAVHGSSGVTTSLVRYDADGTRNPIFGGDGIANAVPDEPSFEVNDVVALADGSALVGGTTVRSGTAQAAVYHVGLNGSPRNYGGGGAQIAALPVGRISSRVDALRALPDGSAVVLMTAWSSATDSEIVLAKLKADGTRDLTFGDANGESRRGFPTLLYGATTLVLGSDGRLVVVGYRTESLGDQFPEVYRLTAEGKADPTFTFAGPSTLGNYRPSAAVLTSGERLVLMFRASRGSNKVLLGRYWL